MGIFKLFIYNFLSNKTLSSILGGGVQQSFLTFLEIIQ